MTPPPLFHLTRGRAPIIVSFPHSGTYLPPEIAERMTDIARTVPDTDWHVPRLYSFLEAMGASRIEATHSWIGMAIRTYYANGAAQYAGWYDLIDGMRGTWNAWGADGTKLADFEPRSGSSDLWSHEIGEVAPGRSDLPPLPDLELLWNGRTTNFDDATLRLGRGSH